MCNPHCEAVNRFDKQRLNQQPKCGKCHQLLLTGEPVELKNDNFDKFISRNDLPVVVDFWASWCQPCQMMAPHFAKAAQALNGQYVFAKVNTEEAQQIAARYGIRSIPTLMVFESGNEKKRVAGAMSALQLVQWLTA
ncbi:MAG: thioredoxin TrxC [Agitococcus sp.]